MISFCLWNWLKCQLSTKSLLEFGRKFTCSHMLYKILTHYWIYSCWLGTGMQIWKRICTKEIHSILIPASKESTHCSFLNTYIEIQLSFGYAISINKCGGGKRQRNLLWNWEPYTSIYQPIKSWPIVLNIQSKSAFLKTHTSGQ